MESRVGLGVLVLQLTVSVLGYTPIDYIDNYCGRTITVQEAVRLKLRSYSWPTLRTCEVTLSSSSLYHSDANTRLLIRFININLSTGPFSACSKSRVDIIDSDGISLSSSLGTCGSYVPYSQPWTSHGNTVTIRLKRLSTFLQSGTFDLLATQFTTGFCDFNEFDCDNGRCIDDSLTCDGRDNCGDNSDEIDDCYWGSGTTAGIAVACIIGFSFFIFVIAAVYRRRTYGRIFWRSNMAYGRGINTVIQTTTTSGTTVASSQFGVQQAAPVFSTPAPPPAYPGSPYPQNPAPYPAKTGYPGGYS